MSTSNGNTSSPSLDQGRPATSGVGQAEASSLEEDLIDFQSALRLAFVALDFCSSDNVASGRAVPHRFDWLDVDCILSHAARRTIRSLPVGSDQRQDDDAVAYVQQVLRLTGTILNIGRCFCSDGGRLDASTVRCLKDILGLCIDAIEGLLKDISVLMPGATGSVQ